MNLAICGFAHGHVGMYCTRWRERPELDIQVIAGWDHDAARLAQNAEAHGLEAVADLDALLDRADIAAVVIGAETARHAELVERAAAAGKAIVLQKPLALTLAEADRIVAAVERHGVPFTMAWQMRVDPHNVQIREMLQSGQFGRVYMVRRRHCLPLQNWPDFVNSWHVQPSQNRDIFADDAAHAIDFLYWLLGEPATVSAELGTLFNPAMPNDNGIAVFRYPDGAFAEASCTFVAVAGENTAEVFCEKGVIIGNYGDLPSTMVPRPAGGIQLKWYLQETGDWTVSDLPDIMGQGERIAGLAEPLAAFLHGRRAPIATAADGRTALRMVLACYVSARDGRRVHLNDPAITAVDIES